MEIKTTWNSVKNIKNTMGNFLFYSTEKEYCSSDPNVDDIFRYYIWIQDGIDKFYCFIRLDDPKNSEQLDFENNYKSSAIET